MNYRLLLFLLALPSLGWCQPNQRYAALQRHALEATPKEEQTVTSLAKYLRHGRSRAVYDPYVKFWVHNVAGDDATAREIYCWIATRIYYLDENEKQWDPSLESAQKVLDHRYGVCHEFAVLFRSLALEAGLEAEYVSGFAGKPGDIDAHAWNAVKIGDAWKTIDTCWANGSYSRSTDFQWFDMPPAQFLKTHLPDTDYFTLDCYQFLYTMKRGAFIRAFRNLGLDPPELPPRPVPWDE